MNRSHMLALSLALSSAALLTSCGGGSPPPPQISVSISPNAAQSVDEGRSVNFTPTVVNDASNKGVTWSLSCSAASCGNLSNQAGTSTTYSAPNPVTANLSVRIAATSAADSAKSSSGSVTVVPPPAVTTTSLQGATGGTAYRATLQESGGVAPFAWTSGSSFPPGLSLSNDGTISGTLTAGGTFNISVQVADSGNPPLTASANLSIAVTVLPLSIVTTSLPDATLDTGYKQSVQATGGIPPYTWTVADGTLPPWATLAASGTLRGTFPEKGVAS